MALITAQEVINATFTHQNTDVSFIKDNFITIAELEYIKPKLGEDLYNFIAAGSLSSKYSTLYTTYIKPAMCYYVKYLALPDLHVNTASAGLMINNREFSQSGSSKDRADLRIETLRMGDMFMFNAIKYIEHEDNIATFTQYGTSEQVSTKIIGGILLD